MKFIFTSHTDAHTLPIFASSEFQWTNQPCHFARIRFQNVQRCNFRRQFVIVSHFIMRKMKCWNNRTNHFRYRHYFISITWRYYVSHCKGRDRLVLITDKWHISKRRHTFHNIIMIMTLCEILYHYYAFCKLHRKRAFKLLWKYSSFRWAQLLTYVQLNPIM